MSTIFGLAQLTASDYQFMRQADNRLIYDAVNMYVAQAMQEMRESAALFVEGTTQKAQERFQLPMGGRMQESSGQSKPGAVRRSGSWDVAYPLKEFSDMIATTDVDFAYMTPQEFQTHIDGILTRAANTYRFEILKRIFKNTTDTFVDRNLGSLTIRPLANGTAGELYPPLIGTEAEATANHYLETGYAATAISDTNNPIRTASNLLISRYGRRTGGVPIITLINSDERDEIEALTNFRPYVPNAIRAGQDTDIVTPPPIAVGETIGYIGSSWVNVWDWIPDNYMVSVYLDAPKALQERVDVAETGLQPGLQLVAREADFPILFNTWRWRFGLGAGNRLSAVVTEIAAGGSYTIPTDYQ